MMQFYREIWLDLEQQSRWAREALGISLASGIRDVHRENWQQGCYPTSPILPDFHQTLHWWEYWLMSQN